MTLAATSMSTRPSAGAARIAICSADRALRGRLERLAGADASLAVAGVVDDTAALTRLLEKNRIDLVLVDSPTAELLLRWTRRYRATAFVAIVEQSQPGALDALRAGAQALLWRSADEADLAVTVAAVRRELCVLPHGLLDGPRSAASAADDQPRFDDVGDAPLTSRELEVLAALADGASNKTIARRLGISFHTVKFHVAGILAKLDADSRTEAVMKAAQLGLVML